MIEIVDKSRCTGCGACAQTCPLNCIQMEYDTEGFLYPSTDKEKCVNCGKCNDICPIININSNVNDKNFFDEPKAYAARIKDEEIRRDSSSGGVFSLVANHVLSENGAVYGCILNKNLEAVHTRIENKEDLHAMRGSKYVQSRLDNTFKDIKNDLSAGKKVLFVGTPCQTAGLFSYLGNKKIPNLITIDFICHGVPSSLVFKDYIKSEESRIGSKMTEHRFRNKDKGWNQTGLQLGSKSVFENGIIVRRYPAFKDKYMNGFLDDICLRSSCYSCNFKSIPKIYSDITIADFWGINRISKDFNDNKGTSLVLINSIFGEKVWNTLCDDAEFRPVEYRSAIRKNAPLTESARINPDRKQFFKDYIENGYEYVAKKYMTSYKWAIHKIIKLASKYLKKCEQFIKFAIVGCSNTLINLATYYALLFLGIHYLAAYTIGFLVSVCNAFYWNNKYVFKNKQEKNIIKAFFKVFSSYGFTFILSILLMSLMVEILGVTSIIAPIIKLIVTIPLNFILNKVWAFKDKNL